MNYNNPFSTILSSFARSFFNRRAVLGSTRSVMGILPLGFLPAPILLPPLLFLTPLILFAKFESQQIGSASELVRKNFRISEHRSLTTKPSNMGQKLYPSLTIQNLVKWNGDAMNGCSQGSNHFLHSYIPSPGNIRCIKCRELYRMTGRRDFIKPITTILHCDARRLETAGTENPVPSRPNFSIQGDFRKTFCKPIGSFNNITPTRPELFSIPESAASIQLFTGKPSSNPFARQIGRQCHLSLRNHCVKIVQSGLLVNIINQKEDSDVG